MPIFLALLSVFLLDVGAYGQPAAWEDAGYGTSSGGFAPTLRVVGVPVPGRSFLAVVRGAPSFGVVQLLVGELEYQVVGGQTIVPASTRAITVNAYAAGGAQASFVWPSLPLPCGPRSLTHVRGRTQQRPARLDFLRRNDGVFE